MGRKKKVMQMSKTLYELFMDAYSEATRIPWRVYGTKSHRLLSSDYGTMRTDELDNLKVSSHSKKTGYFRINVIDE